MKQHDLEKKFELLRSNGEDPCLRQRAPQGISSCNEPEISVNCSVEHSSFSCNSSQFSHLNNEYFTGKNMGYSSYLHPQIPSSLVSHWNSPPKKLQMEISFMSHYVILQQPADKPHVAAKELKLQHQTIFDKYEQEYQDSCRQS